MNLSDIKILSVYQSKPLAWYRPKPDTFIYLDMFQLNDMTISQTWQTFWVIISPSKHTYCHPWEILTRSGWHGSMDDIFFQLLQFFISQPLWYSLRPPQKSHTAQDAFLQNYPIRGLYSGVSATLHKWKK